MRWVLGKVAVVVGVMGVVELVVVGGSGYSSGGCLWRWCVAVVDEVVEVVVEVGVVIMGLAVVRVAVVESNGDNKNGDVYLQNLFNAKQQNALHLCMPVHLYTDVYICMCLCLSVSVCLNVCMHVCNM